MTPTLRRFGRHRLAFGSAALLVLVAALALAAPLLPLPDPDATAPARRLLAPLAAGHLLGTDALGRDLLSRLVWGSRVSLLAGIGASLLAAVVGSLAGLVAGHAGGRTDAVLMRAVDLVMAFPYILMALAIVAALGPGLQHAMLAIAVVNIPFFARNVRGVTLGLSRREFVDAARLAGMGEARILFGEILPNVMPVIVVTLSTTVGWMILETAGLSFLGLGAQPPQADLGSMLGEARRVLFVAPHVSATPGIAIFVIVMAVNLAGDGVRDLLDPRLRGGATRRPAARTAQAPRRTAQRPTPPADPAALLDLNGLRVEFTTDGRTRAAVDDVALKLGAGECLGLIGESGSGKSVTALSIAGLLPSPPARIAEGVARLQGEDLFAIDDRGLRDIRGRRIAHVFQDPLSALHPMKTVGAQIVEAIRAHAPESRASARALALALLERVRMPDPAARIDAYPHELSGGMRQRVCIAMALAHDPELLIADEPTTALDVTVQARILELFDALRRTGDAAILFITHDFGVVSALCDRVAVMYAGQVVETGPAAAILAAPAHPYTAALIDCVPVLGDPGRHRRAIPGQPPSPDDMPAGCRFAERCPRVRPDCRRAPVAMHARAAARSVRCLHPLAGTAGDAR